MISLPNIQKDDVYLKVAKNIKYYRHKKKMTSYELAKKSGYSYAYIRRLKGPRCIKNFSLQTIDNLAKSLDIDIKALFDDNNI